MDAFPDLCTPLKIINSLAPIWIADNGGWTDTWFAGHGKIFNLGVYPYAEVQMEVFPAAEDSSRIVVHAENFGKRFEVLPRTTGWDRPPLLAAPIEYMKVPHDMAVQMTIFSGATAGASTGASDAEICRRLLQPRVLKGAA